MNENNFENFKKTWVEQIKKLENAVIDTRSAHFLYLCFHRDENLLHLSMPSGGFTWGRLMEISLLHSKLVRVIETTRTRYMMQRRSIWDKISERLATILYGIKKSREITGFPEMPK